MQKLTVLGHGLPRKVNKYGSWNLNSFLRVMPVDGSS